MSAIHEDFARLYYHLHPKWTENLSHQSVRILQTIQMKGAMTVKEIANRFVLSPNTASEHVKKLEGLGYIVKQRSSVDQRVVQVSLTREGRTAVKTHTELDAKRVEHVLKQLSPAEQQMIEAAFQLFREATDGCFSD
ncbi:MarR family winged helix-turn-helix transcriptional regulator [Exiguobacterium antarcticum]|uniref:MarR family transcriptional regulator n=1 Tax=Exiguobacterium antarcticum TaxID=132920 RepID=A0ABT6R5U6_9BACL|nr:MarR family transcriptional regulator [Exiguobacterium antarcticum]AFS70501.1 Transcriptional regulator, MarR family [Exiguobacterium antarcticum B7]MDI3236332.1 MarR family transcriptional regulator [Exiguobacterium antarcticum]